MAFRRAIPQTELRERLTEKDRQEHGTDYSPSRGGWVRSEPKPTPGAGNGTRGRLFGGAR
ncbi:hypothetical protein AB0C52_35785 [Streptomyces sp. NPDC048717]|uniref:hypothetical protein n=1 Tax=Streptomyces sp. NPDC048717 TaxID=3154928 RepID=UPI003433D8D7